jgi:septal ring factor EnvC (AmiA/AmiB activator)
VSSVPRHSEEELRQQWAFLDALVERQATSLKSGAQDPEEEDLPVAAVEVDGHYQEEISALTRRVSSLESERTTLLRRIDLSEQARMAAESARMAAEAARASAERALAEERVRAEEAASAPAAPVATPPVTATPPVSEPPAETLEPLPARPLATGPRARRRSWWQRFRE